MDERLERARQGLKDAETHVRLERATYPLKPLYMALRHVLAALGCIVDYLACGAPEK